MQPSEEIKQRIDIVDLIREYIPLKAAGVNFKAKCPFHREKTPSFMVSPAKQIWHCFGCGKGGDIFTFIMEMEGLDFVGALKLLAPKAGVELKRVDPKTASQRTRLLELLDLSARYYHHILMQEKAGENAKRYLIERGLTLQTIKDWQIGYSLDSWEGVSRFLRQRGFGEGEIFAAGMTVKKEGRQSFYDRFRGRIMFPIRDSNGRVVAFTARLMPSKEKEENAGGKYINSPQTLVYDKSSFLFGLDKAKLAIKENNLAVVVEGQMDVITAHQHNFKNVVASSGTALTAEQDTNKPLKELNKQLNLLKRYTTNLALAFDMDKAGKAATRRGVEEALSLGFNVKIIVLPEGEDPDSFIKKDPRQWQRAVAAAKPVIAYYLDETVNNLDRDDPSQVKQAVEDILKLINILNSKVEQDYWIKRLGERLNIEEHSLREELKRVASLQTTSYSFDVPELSVSTPILSRPHQLSRALLALVIKFSQHFRYAVDNLPIECLVGEEYKLFYKNLILYYNNHSTSSQEGEWFNFYLFQKWLQQEANQNQLSLLNELVLLGERDYFQFSVESAKQELIQVTKELRREFLGARRREIESMIKDMEAKGDDPQKIQLLLEELQALWDEEKSL